MYPNRTVAGSDDRYIEIKEGIYQGDNQPGELRDHVLNLYKGGRGAVK